MLNSTFPAGLPASDGSAGLEVSEPPPPPPPELVGEGAPGVEVTGSFASGLALTRTLSMIYHQLAPSTRRARILTWTTPPSNKKSVPIT